MAPTHYTCERCPLNGGQNHRVPKLDRVLHQIDVKAQQARDAQAQPELTVDHLANLLTTVVTLDDGIDPRNQLHSKLFSSRDEVQATAPDIPLQYTPVSAADAFDSIQSLLPPKLTLHTMARQTRHENEALLKDTLQRIHAAHRDLDMHHALNDDIRDLRRSLEMATSTVLQAGRLLASIKPPSKAKTGFSVQENEAFKSLLQMVKDEARLLDSLIDVVGRLVPKSVVKDEVQYDSDHHFQNPIGDYDTVAQVMIILAVICHVIIGISTNPCDLILKFVSAIIQLTMSIGSSEDERSPRQDDVLKQLPTSLETALNKFKIDSKTIIYATCPSCHCTHAPTEDRLTGDPIYPENCVNYVYPQRGPARVCGKPILEMRQGKLRPIKPFVYAPFLDYLAATLSDPEVETMCQNACDKAFQAVQNIVADDPDAPRSAESVTNVFEAEFLRTFQGPVPDQLFIEQDGRLRLAFEVMLDFFNPDGTRKRGNHNSIGILAVVNLNLPEDIRYRPEFMWISIILGPDEANFEEINHYVRPLVDDFVKGWERGIYLSRTALYPAGRRVDIILAISINDLPATRKITGMAAASSHHFCMICDCYGVNQMHRTDFENWNHKDIDTLRSQAYAWRDAPTQAARDKIFAEHGVRWSEFWRLPYWDPTRMTAVDSMHCILEGLVHYHCRKVLRIDATAAQRKEHLGAAFEYDWVDYDPAACHPDYHLKNPAKEVDQVHRIHKILEQPLSTPNDDEGDTEMLDIPTVNVDQMRVSLMNTNLPALRFVVNSLGLDLTRVKTKKLCCDQLLAWRFTKPRFNPDSIRRSINLPDLKFIQTVIVNTHTPSWIGSVPHNYGESNAGTIKAAEWRILATVYLPIALVLLWGDLVPENGRLQALLDHTMALFAAVTIVCRNTMSFTRATQYRQSLKQWVDGLPVHHPHTKTQPMRPNIHVAFHIYDFLIAFGPVTSWWCFPFERVIGLLQRVNTNHHVGGQLEATLTKSFMRGAYLRRWLRRPDCPQVIRELKQLFDQTFPSYNPPSDSPPRAADGPCAHYKYNGVNFSRADVHVGNSLVFYYPANSTTAIPGSIQEIMSVGGEITLTIRRQTPLPANLRDPFKRYRGYFPARTYLSTLQVGDPDKVPITAVLSHYARYDFSEGRSVVLDLSRS